MNKLTLTILVTLITTLTCCKKPNNQLKNNKNKIATTKDSVKKLPTIEITLKNIKSRNRVVIDNEEFFTKKTKVFTTFTDSIEVYQKTFLNTKPTTEKITYQVPENEVINLTIDADVKKYDYFLTAKDQLTVEFDNNGFILKSSLNGKENHPALVFANNTIPNKVTEYLKQIKKHLGNVNDKTFEKNFNQKLTQKTNHISSIIEQHKNDLQPVVYNSLKNQLTLIDIKNQLTTENNVEIPLNDAYLNMNIYRNLKDEILKKYHDISFLDNEKLGIDTAFETIKIATQSDDFKEKPKTGYLIIQELLDKAGSYEPNLLPELIAKIPDTTIRNDYLNLFTKQYLLGLKEKRNNSETLNLISVENQKDINSFQDFLNKNKGKVIYVDLWASWCGPCRNQLKASHKLKNDLKNKPIVFGYFSTDKSFSKWKTANIEEDMADEENTFLLLNTKKSKRYLSWKVNQIPKYLIFDKTGKLVDNNAPFPSNKKAIEILLKYVNQ